MKYVLHIVVLVLRKSSALAQHFEGGQLSPPPRHLAGLEKREVRVEVSYEGRRGSREP